MPCEDCFANLGSILLNFQSYQVYQVYFSFKLLVFIGFLQFLLSNCGMFLLCNLKVILGIRFEDRSFLLMYLLYSFSFSTIFLSCKEILLSQQAIISSMTIKERRNPDIMNASRRKRIASGSGTSVQDVNSLLKQFRQMKDMMKKFSGGNRKKLMRQLSGKLSVLITLALL